MSRSSSGPGRQDFILETGSSNLLRDATLKHFEQDDETEAVLIIGEIGGPQEAEAAEYFKKHMTKPMAAYIAGLTAPPGRLMGHAGAIVSSSRESAAEKVQILEDAGVLVSPTPSDMGVTMARLLQG